MEEVLGKCYVCKKDIVTPGKYGGVKLCDDCVKIKNEQYKLRAIEYRKNGQCPKHPSRPIVEGGKFCKECLWYAIIYVHKGITDEEVTKVLERQNYICPISGHKLEKGINASIDHIIPIGKHRKDKDHKLNSIDNLRIVDEKVNKLIEGMTEEEYIQLCRDVVAYQDRKK